MADIETVPFGRQVERGGKKSSLFRSRRYYNPPSFVAHIRPLFFPSLHEEKHQMQAFYYRIHRYNNYVL